MVCLTATEFDKLLNRLDSAENDLATSTKRITLLEDTLRTTEQELKQVSAERDALNKCYENMKNCAKPG
jgi:septal ring factor EnvC (AmiA/AmiB activator)